MTIKSKDSVELFGVNVNDKLTFEKHIKKLCRSASCQLNTILRLKNVLNFHAKKKKKKIIESFAYSNLDYCSILWHFCIIKNHLKKAKSL